MCGIVVAYGVTLFMFPSDEAFARIDDVDLREAMRSDHIRAWLWSLAIACVSATAALMALRLVRGWRLVTLFGAALVFLLSGFPITIYRLFFEGVTSFEHLSFRLSIYFESPAFFSSMVVYSILAPLIYCAVLYLAFVSYGKGDRNTPSNQPFNTDALKRAG